MRCVVVKYFKDESGTWHQPGELLTIDEDKAKEYEEKRLVSVQTRMVAPPKTRRKSRAFD